MLRKSIKWYDVNHCTLISCVSIFSKPSQKFLRMIILRGELMRFVIYVDDVQQFMHALQGQFVKLQIILYILKNILTQLWDLCAL